MAKGRALTRRRVYVKARRAYHRPKTTIPMAMVIGLAPVVLKGVEGIQTGLRGGDLVFGLRAAANNISQSLLAWDFIGGQFTPGWLRYGLYPLILGMVTHKVIGGMFGVNRFLSRAGVPLLRI